MRELALTIGIAFVVGGLALGGYTINQMKRTRPMRKQSR